MEDNCYVVRKMRKSEEKIQELKKALDEERAKTSLMERYARTRSRQVTQERALIEKRNSVNAQLKKIRSEMRGWDNTLVQEVEPYESKS